MLTDHDLATVLHSNMICSSHLYPHQLKKIGHDQNVAIEAIEYGTILTISRMHGPTQTVNSKICYPHNIMPQYAISHEATPGNLHDITRTERMRKSSPQRVQRRGTVYDWVSGVGESQGSSVDSGEFHNDTIEKFGDHSGHRIAESFKFIEGG